MTVVVDASATVSLLIDAGPVGRWVEEVLAGERLAAPHLMPGEAANILRRRVLAGAVSSDVASVAHADLVALPFDLVPYEACADRVWELRQTVTAYDAWYVAVAEVLGATMVTLDLRLARAPGPRCRFSTPPGSD